MNRSIIFITMMLAASALSSEQLLPTTEMLGVDGCFPEQVKRVAKFLNENIIKNYRASIYYHTCSFEMSPSDDTHSYAVNVRLNKVECALTFSTGHFDQDTTFHGDHSEAQRKIQECREKLEASKPDLKDEVPIIREEEVVLPKELDLPSLSEAEAKELKHQLFKKMQIEAGQTVHDQRAANRAQRDAGIGMSDEDYGNALRKLFKVVEEHRANPEDEDYSETFNQLFATPEPTPEEIQKEEELGEFMQNKVDPVHEMTRDIKLEREEPLMGGMNRCNPATKLHLKNLLVNLMNQDVFRGFVIYTENIVECEAQVVAGMNYKAIVSFNHKERCPIQIFEHLSGSVTLTNQMALFHDEVCSGYFTHSTFTKLQAEASQPLDKQ